MVAGSSTDGALMTVGKFTSAGDDVGKKVVDMGSVAKKNVRV
jgi:hypothetical protein